MIAEMTQYTDEKRRRIWRFTDIVTGELHFSGDAAYHKTVPQGTIQFPLSFPIEAETIEEAYDNWDEAIKPAIAKAEAEMAKHAAPRVQRAPGGILDTGGVLIRPAGPAGGNGDRIR